MHCLYTRFYMRRPCSGGEGVCMSEGFWMQGTTRRKINCFEYVPLPDLL